jgi:hypothetical protein
MGQDGGAPTLSAMGGWTPVPWRAILLVSHGYVATASFSTDRRGPSSATATPVAACTDRPLQQHNLQKIRESEIQIDGELDQTVREGMCH